MKLATRNVWLIGASSGIGAALVPGLVAAGARLAISARSADSLEALASTHAREGQPLLAKPLDVTEDGACERVAAEIGGELGPIDILIYCAGQWEPVEVESWDTQSLERQIAVNFTGFVRALGAVLPGMVSRHSGDIVGVASVAGYAGFPRAAAYSSTKAAVLALLQTLRIDLTAHGVGVTTVSPGFVDTPLTRKNDFPMPFMIDSDEAARRIIQGLLAGRREIHFPRRLTWAVKLLTVLPGAWYEAIARRFLARGV
jgi:short-subunit dehydrogenase